MAVDDTGFLLNRIGNLLTEDREYSSAKTLLFVEMYGGGISVSIFKSVPAGSLYRYWNSQPLNDALFDLWEGEPKGSRWSELEYVTDGSRFEAFYIYPDDIQPGDNAFDRRDRAVVRHLGDKPIVYPPWPPTDDDIRER